MAVKDLTIAYRATDSIKGYARNARTHTAEQVAKIAASIKEFGFTNPILLKDDGVTIGAGHGRHEAAKSLGLSKVPTIILKGLTDVQWRAYVLADNRIALDADWDLNMLRSEIGEIQGLGFDMDLTGFGGLDLAALFKVDRQNTDPDDVPDVPSTPISIPGDMWVLGEHRIICGSSTDPATVERLLAGAKPHLMVTDPPYGVEYDPEWRNRVIRANGTRVAARATGVVMNDDRSDWSEAWALFPGNVAYVWHGGLHAASVALSLETTGFDLRAQIIWNKAQMIIGRGDYHWKHEPCWYAVRPGVKGGARWNKDRKQTTIWDIEHRKSETGHGTQKPVEAMRRPIENNSKAGDLVYEPFSGSGTTIIAGEMTGRAVLAVELNPAYVDVAVKRWSDFTGQEPFHEDGRAWSDVISERGGAA